MDKSLYEKLYIDANIQYRCGCATHEIQKACLHYPRCVSDGKLLKPLKEDSCKERKVIDYIIVCRQSITDIQASVLENCLSGYCLQGGIFVTGGDTDQNFTISPIYYYQAMVKYE